MQDREQASSEMAQRESAARLVADATGLSYADCRQGLDLAVKYFQDFLQKSKNIQNDLGVSEKVMAAFTYFLTMVMLSHGSATKRDALMLVHIVGRIKE